METKKSIQDIKRPDSSGEKSMSDIIGNKTTRKRVKPIVKETVDDFYFNKDEIIDDTKESTMTPMSKTKKGKIKRVLGIVGQIKPFYLITFTIIILALIVLLFVPGTSKDPATQAKKESEMIKKELSKHMILPKDEEIDIRKITSKVEDPFFKDAEIGDYLIIFYKNRIAYIYSLDKDIIINAGVVFIDPKTATTTPK